MDEVSLRRRVELLEEEVRDLNRRLREIEPSPAPEPAPAPVVPEVISEEQPHAPAAMPPPLPPPTPERAWAAMAKQKTESTPVYHAFPPETEEVPATPVPAVIAKPLPPRAINNDAELRIGQVWAVRIGVLLLFTGFVFLANYAWEHYISHLGALPRLMLLTLLATGGVAAGEIMRRKPRLGTFGEVIAAGGLAALYYCAFAAHHIDRLRVIEQPSIGALLLTLTGMGILGFGVWRKAPVMCAIALLLSFYGTSIQPVALTAMISGFVLAAVGAWLCVRYRWKSLGVVGLVGAYVAFILWQGLLYEAPAFSLAAWFLCSYWLLYNAVVLHQKNPWSDSQSVIISSLNHGLLAAVLPFDWSLFDWDSRGWMVYAVIGTLTMAIGFLLEKFRGRHRLSEAHLVQGIGLLTLAVVTKWSGHELFIILAIKGIVLLGWDRWSKRTNIEICGYLIMLLTMPLTLTCAEKDLSSNIWLLYAALLFTALCVARREIDLTSATTPLRQIARWFIAVATILTLSLGVLQPLPDAQGALWMIGISLVFYLVNRYSGKRFPAPEILPLILAAAFLAEMGLCLTSPLRTEATLLIGAALAFAHALVYPQTIRQWKSTTAREMQGLLLSIGAWSILGCYGVMKMPFETWTALAAAGVMIAVHALATPMKWDILRGVTPLFSLAVLIMAQPFSNEHTHLLYAVYAVLMGYAAWLTLREKEAPLAPLPLIVGALGLMWLFSRETHGSIALLVIPMALWLTPLRSSRTWFSVIVCFAGVSFFCYLNESSKDLLTYTVPMLWYAALTFRARVWQKPSHIATKIIALLVTVSMSAKLSLWVGLDGDGHELTILWALLAVFCFAMGFVIRERLMRLMMLLLLLASMGKILISVWQLGTLLRIVSFLVTGVIFLLLGFVYNKYPEWFGKENNSPETPPAS